jgi:hypothetical protein
MICAALIGCWVSVFMDARFISTADFADWLGALLLFAIFVTGGFYFSKRLKR